MYMVYYFLGLLLEHYYYENIITYKYTISNIICIYIYIFIHIQKSEFSDCH